MAMGEAELLKVQHTAREMQKVLTANANAVNRIYDVWRTRAAEIQAVFAMYTRAIDTIVASMGGALRIQQFAQEAGEALLRFAQTLPPNWPMSLDFAVAMEMANDGIPVVWIPRESILLELVKLETYAERLALLQAHRDELGEDMERVIAEVTHPTLAGQVPLAKAALEAWKDGHKEAAQALAVPVIETVVTRHYADRRRYPEVRAAAKLDLEKDELEVSKLRLDVAMGPIWSFYTPWWPSSGLPPPPYLSRHATVHQADAEHFSADNALIAVLLQTSVLRAFQEVLSIQDAEAESAAP